jgi:hypothetical protein
MMISLSQALKEKNRIAGELANAWRLIALENSMREDKRRVTDLEELYKTIRLYTEKLIELKTKIGLANAGNLENIYRMEECKNELQKIERINTDESSDFQKISDSEFKEYKRTVVFNSSVIWDWKQKLQQECNRLQDEMDTYNATTKIDFETPLSH